MKNRLLIILSICLTILIFQSPVLANQSGLLIPDQVTGESAYEHVYYLSEVIGARVASTTKEAETANYIANQFAAMGYDVEIQPFTYERGEETYASENVIATKQGKFDQTLIVGAHYDSVSERSCADGNVLTGAGDNASGIAVILEAAEVLTNYKTRGTIKFIAFGAEEVGLRGSRFYADQMTEKEIQNTVAMINLDSVGVGDHFNVYSGKDNNPGWVRDLALKIGQGIGHDIRTSPGNQDLPDCPYDFAWGETADWSDHAPFRLLGIPIAYFEMMNWELDTCEGIETADYGWVMHTCMDNLSMVSIEKLEMTAEVVAALAFQISKNKLPKAKKGKVAKGNKYISIKKRNSLQD
jgi:hypothetical protein